MIATSYKWGKLVQETDQANYGDIAVTRCQIAHYEHMDGGDAEAEKWRAKARALDDPEEMHLCAYRLLISAMEETDQIRRQKMLIEAQKNATRSCAISGESVETEGH